MVFWAMVARVCRVTEWILWTRKCWVGGALLIASYTVDTVPYSVGLQNSYEVRQAGEADFFPSWTITAAAIVEYYIADRQFRGPFTLVDANCQHSHRALSTSRYLDIYWSLIEDQAADVFGCPLGALEAWT